MRFDPDDWWRVKPKTIIAIILATVTVCGMYYSLNAKSETHTSDIFEIKVAIKEMLSAAKLDHETLILDHQTVGRLETKLDYLTGARRGPKPDAAPAAGPTGNPSIP